MTSSACCQALHMLAAFLFLTSFIYHADTQSFDWSESDDIDCAHGIMYMNSSTLERLYGAEVAAVNRYVFLGDSTSRDAFHAFGEIFHYTCAEQLKGVDNRHCTKRIKQQRKLKGISTAEFFPFGRKQGWKRSMSKAYRQIMQGFVAQMTHKDVLIFNMGLHFDETATSNNFTLFYTSALSTLLDDLGLTTRYSRQQRCMNLTDPYLPRVLWRDTLPQHFNSSNGHFPFLNTSERNICVPLSPSQRTGGHKSVENLVSFQSTSTLSSSKTIEQNGTGTGAGAGTAAAVCDPSCLPANWQNHVAHSFMQDMCVDSLSVWREFSCLHSQHAGAYQDCSHLSTMGNLVLIGRMVEHLFDPARRHRKASSEEYKTLFS